MFTKFITKKIQEKLKAKERALARLSVGLQDPLLPDALTLNDLASRTVFVRMCSNKSKVKNILISGGEHRRDDPSGIIGGMAFGYQSTYKNRTDNPGNSGIRGIPGIKDITVEYKGGFKAIREATINWTVPAIEDLDELTPHFLTVGKTVAIDWGWVLSNKDSLQTQIGVKPFIYYETDADGNRIYQIDQTIFTNPQGTVLKAGGDYDAMAGQIKNFNYNLRDDGGFDCVTTITGLGSALMKKAIDVSGNTLGTVKLTQDSKPQILPPDTLVNCILNLRNVIVYDAMGITGNTKLGEQFNSLESESKMIYKNFTGTASRIRKDMHGITVDNKDNPNIIWLVQPGGVEDILVTWAWFEDQILNRYLSYDGGSEDGKGIKMTMRSVNAVLHTEGDDEGNPIVIKKMSNEDQFDLNVEEANLSETLKESVHIRNPPLLLGVDPFKFSIIENNLKILGSGIDTNTGTNWLGFKNESLSERDKFLRAFLSLANIEGKSIASKATGAGKDGFSKSVTKSKTFANPDNIRNGRLRNIFVNITEIQKAFGMKDPKNSDNSEDNVNPPGTIESAMKRLLSALNSNFHNIWDFDLVTDQFDTTNIKVIDKSDTESTDPEYTSFNDNSHKVKKTGIFSFPSYKIGSIVKNQSLEFKIPDAQALSILYGSNKIKGESDAQSIDSKLDKLLYLDGKGGEGDPYADKYLESLKSSNVLPPTELGKDQKGPPRPLKIIHNVGSENASENSKIVRNQGPEISIDSKYFWRKFTPKIKKPGAKEADDPKSSEQEYYEITKDSDGNPTVSYIIATKKAGKQTEKTEIKAYYVTDEKSKHIVLLAEAQGALRSYLNASSPASQFDMTTLIPAELGLEIDGTGGILPGDIVHTDYIQNKYKQPIGELVETKEKEPVSTLGPLTYFQIFGITQKITPAGWLTEIQTKMRINRMPGSVNLKDYQRPKKARKKIKAEVIGDPFEQVKRPYIETESDLDVDILGDEDLDLLDFDFDAEMEELAEFDKEVEPWIPAPYPSTIKLDLDNLKKELEEPEDPYTSDNSDTTEFNDEVIDNEDTPSDEDLDKELNDLLNEQFVNQPKLKTAPLPKKQVPIDLTPNTPVKKSEPKPKPKNKLEQIKQQDVIWIGTVPSDRNPTNSKKVEKQKDEVFKDVETDKIDMDVHPEISQIKVNEVIKKDKIEEEIIIELPELEVTILKSTYDGLAGSQKSLARGQTLSDGAQYGNAAYLLSHNFTLMYQLTKWNPNKDKAQVDFYGEGVPSDAGAKSGTKILQIYRQKFWDELIEAPNETGISEFNIGTPEERLAKMRARRDEIGTDTYRGLEPYDSWIPTTGIAFATDEAGNEIKLPTKP